MFRLDAHDDPDDRLQLLRLLLADRDWRCDPPVRRLLRGLLEEPPVAGEASWQALAEELADYLAFRRLGDFLARLSGCPRDGLRFTRADWEAQQGTGLPWTGDGPPARAQPANRARRPASAPAPKRALHHR